VKTSIRIDHTNPLALRVQVVRYEQRRPVVLKHIGTAHTEEELEKLKQSAQTWIIHNPPQPRLFAVSVQRQNPDKEGSPQLVDCEFQGVWHTYTYEFLYRICAHFKFTLLKHPILIDLIIMRIFEPTSKLRSLMLLSKYFNREHSESALYRSLKHFPVLKQSVETKMVTIAKNEFGFDFSFVLYDVTTLYFETFKADTLRKPGFSKDSKSQQPQIVVGLMVTPLGFPVSYEVFTGNTFEGTTFLPSILAFKSLHHIETLTIVADAAMLSLENTKKLVENDLTYVVGARLGSISTTLLETIDTTLIRSDQQSMRTDTQSGTLICSFSKKRYSKDLSEMNKQIKKAEVHIQTPGKMKRAKFVQATTGKVSLNEALIARNKKMLGVKGYYTNLKDVSDADIIAHYHTLWNVEQAFRIAKSDLASRPIFHRKETSIRAHMLICVMALAISKYIEIKTKQSIRSVLDLCRTVVDAQLVHKTTGIKNIMRSPISEEMDKIQKILSH
jgi:transposase